MKTQQSNRWVDRKFEFEGLEGTYVNILERLWGTPLRLRAKVAGMKNEDLTRNPEGKWSIQVHSGHLLTLESLWLGRLDDFVRGATDLRAWNPTNEETELAKFNDQDLAVVLDDFEMIRLGMVKVLRKLEGQEESLTALHPRLKTPMRLLDMVYFIAEHDDHHLATIERIKGS
ncbi:MAG: DinB family protein [Flavobacteriales bacterium]|nr:DinB family protein [Flavobacteriales bacterium]